MTGEADFIVVGAGSAGCAVARRLADKGARVLLLEAGKSDKTPKSRIPALVGSVVNDPAFDWCYSAEADSSVGGRQDIWPAGKRLGGGSAINGMMFIRGHRHDYDLWASLGAKGWDYASVLPYFRRMEDNERGEDQWRGVGGPVSVSEVRSHYPIAQSWIDAVQQAGFCRSPDLNGEIGEGADFIQLSQSAGLRCSSARAYLQDKPKTLEVLLERQVERILFAEGKAAGVILRHGKESHRFSARRGVVLCAGTLNTPRLLMLSGFGPVAHLREQGIETIRDLPGVGANLQEHVGTHLVNNVSVPTLNNDASGLAGVKQLLALLLLRKGALTTGIGHAQAFLRTREGLAAPNIQLIFSAFAFDVTATGNLAMRKDASVSTFIALARPMSRGQVLLKGNDPNLPPVIRHQLLGSDDDLNQLVEGVSMARRILQQAAISDVVMDEIRPGTNPEDDDALRIAVRTASLPMYHPVGTARVGDSADPMAVVDADLAVRGISGLWVADASIMPTIPAGNTNATAIMIGDKAADHICKARP